MCGCRRDCGCNGRRDNCRGRRNEEFTPFAPCAQAMNLEDELLFDNRNARRNVWRGYACYELELTYRGPFFYETPTPCPRRAAAEEAAEANGCNGRGQGCGCGCRCNCGCGCC